jgi:ABC-type phosphate/phosphonate transport system substrate-binding protein
LHLIATQGSSVGTMEVPMPDELQSFDTARTPRNDDLPEGSPSLLRLHQALAPTAGALGKPLRQVSASEYAVQAGQLTLVATPQYRGAAADGPFLRWAVAVRSDAPVNGLADLAGRRLAVVAGDADGATLFRAEVAPLARGPGFFGEVIPCGEAASALDAVEAQAAEVALVDGLSWTARAAVKSNRVRLRLLQWTPRAPAPPLVVDASAPAGSAEALADALDALASDPAARRQVLAPLGVERFHRLPKAQYRALLHYDQIASSLGYEALR